jgi:hypothetical protein
MKFSSAWLLTVTTLVVTSVLVAGCANVQGVYKNYKDKEELAYVNDAKQSCTRYGFKVDTDAFAQCVNTNANAAKDRDALVKAAFHAEKK